MLNFQEAPGTLNYNTSTVRTDTLLLYMLLNTFILYAHYLTFYSSGVTVYNALTLFYALDAREKRRWRSLNVSFSGAGTLFVLSSGSLRTDTDVSRNT